MGNQYYRQKTCKYGHNLSGKNLRISRTGQRVCKQCKRDRANKTRHTKKGREQRKFNRLYTLYRLRREDIERMLITQKNCCSLCGKPFDKQLKGQGIPGLTWVVDHDHKTTEVRELLHRDCNVALGLLQDSPEMCKMAAQYLEKHKCRLNHAPNKDICMLTKVN